MADWKTIRSKAFSQSAQIDVNTGDADGWTALHHAVCHCDAEIVASLLSHDPANVHARSNDGLTPMLVMMDVNIAKGTQEIIATLTQLIAYGADLSATTNEGMTVVHQAIKHLNADVLQWLLNHGAEVCLTVRSEAHGTPLSYAYDVHFGPQVNAMVERFQQQCIDALLPCLHSNAPTALLVFTYAFDLVAPVSRDLFVIAMEKGDLPMVQRALAQKAPLYEVDINSDLHGTRHTLPPVHFAAHYGHVAVLQALLAHTPTPTPARHTVDVNHMASGVGTPLYCAITCAQAGPEPPIVAMLTLLAAHGADIKAPFRYGRSVLHFVVGRMPSYYHNTSLVVEVLEWLLAHGADSCLADLYENLTPVEWALKYPLDGHVPVICCLLKAALTFRPNHTAAVRDSLPFMARDLVNIVLDYHLIDLSRASPPALSSEAFFEAVVKQQVDTVQLALTQPLSPVSVNARRDENQRTALHLVPSLNVTRVLLSHAPPADANARDRCGQTPLHRLLARGPRAVVAMAAELVAYGADINAVDASGRNVLHHGWKILWWRTEKQTVLDGLLSLGAHPCLTMSTAHGTPYACALACRTARPYRELIPRMRQEYATALLAYTGVTPSIVMLILDYGFDCVGRLTTGQFLEAAREGHTEAVLAHLALPMHARRFSLRDRLEDPSWADCTALHLAAFAGRADIVRALLDEPTLDVHATLTRGGTGFEPGATALHLAMSRAHPATVLAMLAHPLVQPSLFHEQRGEQTPLDLLIHLHRWRNSQATWQRGWRDTENDTETNYEFLESVTVDSVNQQMHAFRVECRVLLGRRFANAPRVAQLCLDLAFDRSQLVVTENDFFRAVHACDLEAVERGLTQTRLELSVHTRDHTGATALHYAAQRSQPRLVTCLLRLGEKFGADAINACDNAQRMPLHCAVRGNLAEDPPSARVLSRDRGHEERTVAGAGLFGDETASGIGGIGGVGDVLAVLASLHGHGAVMTSSTGDGDTAVHLAVHRWGEARWTVAEAQSVLDWLLRHGAGPCLSHRSESGWTPLEFAVERKWSDVVAYLQSHADSVPGHDVEIVHV